MERAARETDPRWAAHIGYSSPRGTQAELRVSAGTPRRQNGDDPDGGSLEGGNLCLVDKSRNTPLSGFDERRIHIDALPVLSTARRMPSSARTRRVQTIALVLAATLLPVAAAVAPPSARPDAGAPTRLAVYFVQGDHVSPVRRAVPHTSAVARAALTALLRGPTAAERRAGYGSAIPTGTTVHGISIAHDTATIDLDRRFEAGGGSLSMLLRIAQVVYSATQFESVHNVVFRINGKPVQSIGGEGVIVAPRIGRANFEDQTPPILVEQPLPGDTVRVPIVVRGTANVFEARLVVEIVSARGIVLARKALSASAGTGTRGSFEAAVRVHPTTGEVWVVIYAPSPKNGSPINTVRIPVVAR